MSNDQSMVTDLATARLRLHEERGWTLDHATSRHMRRETWAQQDQSDLVLAIDSEKAMAIVGHAKSVAEWCGVSLLDGLDKYAWRWECVLVPLVRSPTYHLGILDDLGWGLDTGGVLDDGALERLDACIRDRGALECVSDPHIVPHLVALLVHAAHARFGADFGESSEGGYPTPLLRTRSGRVVDLLDEVDEIAIEHGSDFFRHFLVRVGAWSSK